MSDSTNPDLDAKHERNREQRIEAVKRWVEYIQSEPVEVWGPQQNAIVDGQLDAAQSADLSPEHQQRVKSVAKEIMEARDGDEDTSE